MVFHLMSNILNNFAGPLYSFFYHTANKKLLGITVGAWIRFLPPFLLILIALIQGWPFAWVVVGLGLFIILRLFYWKAKRDGYVRFVSDDSRPSTEGVHSLADEEKVSIQATGHFSVKDREAYTLLRQAEYWRLANGDHAVMVHEKPKRFLYQFIQPGSLQQVQSGLLHFGREPKICLAISFLTSWGPEFSEENLTLYSSNDHSPKKMRRKIYLTFPSEQIRQAVWNNLLRDAGQPISKKL
jgi:hypothetical protein